MALPAAGSEINFTDLNNQLKRPGTQAIQLNDAQVRALAVKPSGVISMNDLGGKWAGSRLTVGNLDGITSGARGFKTPGHAVALGLPNAQVGNCEGEYAGANVGGITWASGGLYVATVVGAAQPNSNTIKITDDSFNVIGTYTLGAWNKQTAGGGYVPVDSWLATASVASNPLGATGAIRWFTW